MFDGLITGSLARAISDSVSESELVEIRMRAGRQLLLLTSRSDCRRLPVRLGCAPYIVRQEEIDELVYKATEMSVYSKSEQLLSGYISTGKLRIGVLGEGVSEGGKLIGLKHICGLVIRVPHQVRTAADGLIGAVTEGGRVKSALVISRPGGGKTTVLRELARLLSKEHNVVIVDERYELAAVADGRAGLDVGDAEVLSGIPKTVAYENCVRASDPEVIVTDELFKKEEVNAVQDMVRCGVSVLASVHGDGVESLKKSDIYSPLLGCFDLAVELEPLGKVVRTVRL